MKILFIDNFSGISGDMMLGALINAGVPVDYLQKHLQKMNLREFSLEIKTVKKHNIYATKATVNYNPEKQPHRDFLSIKKMIEESELSKYVKKKAVSAFRLLGEAEAKIHHSSLDKIHFHEVGAVDSICDLVGSFIGVEYLGIEKVYGTAVPLGSGFTRTAHGMMPVPSPAAMEILKDYPVLHKDSGYEMTTPTGATILKTLVDEIIVDDALFQAQTIAYGAGSYDSEKWPNLLRLIVAEEKRQTDNKKIVIETHVDDMNPEMIPHVMQKLFDLGVNDVFLTHIIMKKGRPGIKITVICDESKVNESENILFSETSTLGTRRYYVDRSELKREQDEIEIKYGTVKVKKTEYQGKIRYMPEYESCRKIALEKNIPIAFVYKEIDKFNTE